MTGPGLRAFDQAAAADLSLSLMKDTNRLGEMVRSRRRVLALTQRSLAQKLGIQPSFVAFIENGRRRPSLRLIARLADTLGVDRQSLLLLAYPEAKEFITEATPEPRKTSASWRRFVENRELLRCYGVSDGELRVLESLELVGTVHSAKEFLAILMLIRDIPC